MAIKPINPNGIISIDNIKKVTYTVRSLDDYEVKK